MFPSILTEQQESYIPLESVLTVLGGIERIRKGGSSQSEDGGTAPVHERTHELLVRSLGERSEKRHDNLLLVRGQVASDLSHCHKGNIQTHRIKAERTAHISEGSAGQVGVEEEGGGNM